jgi:hypothetical protein
MERLMEICFNVVRHIFDEVEMGHKIFFRPCDDADAISATANTRGFTPLTAIVRRYRWDRELIKKAAEECNSLNEVIIVDEVKPTLLLVPKTREVSEIAQLTENLIESASQLDCKILHFTHFGFTQGRYPTQETLTIILALGYYTNPSVDDFNWVGKGGSIHQALKKERLRVDLASSRKVADLQKIVWDYDFRRANSLIKSLRKLESRKYSLVEYVGAMALLN